LWEKKPLKLCWNNGVMTARSISKRAKWRPGAIYPLSEKELETLQEWLKEMLQTGKI